MHHLLSSTEQFPDRVAISSQGKDYSYQYLMDASASFAGSILGIADDLKEKRICLLATPGIDYVVGQWAIWRAGGIAVPLHPSHPAESIQYILEDTDASLTLISEEFRDKISPLVDTQRILPIPREFNRNLARLPSLSPERRAMILYTSGTTGRPKGVVSTHQMIQAQIKMLVDSWGWAQNDSIVNILPLHHVHGIINVVSCALYSGAQCHFLPRFDEDEVFDLVLEDKLTLFMAVPTIYYKLINRWESYSNDRQTAISKALGKLRLMVSGSAALPVSTLAKWKEISGHTLLERYGMTEMGMAISNPLHGERRPGHIGQPLPGVEVKLDRESPGDEHGEIFVKGPNVFSEYWGKAEATAEAFSEEGWFKTGDVADYRDGYYRILGRRSVDIIKSGGYKISALEIEEAMRSFNGISDCAVVGVEDEEWGEVVSAAMVASGVDMNDLKIFLSKKLPSYKMPRRFLEVDELPRNAMGKVTKKKVKELFA